MKSRSLVPTKEYEALITLRNTAGFSEGCMLSAYEKDTSKWRRFWHFVTFRPAPMKRVMYKVTRVVDSQNLKIKRCK